MMLDPKKVIPFARGKGITGGDFFYMSNAMIWDAAVELHDQGTEPDCTTLGTHLTQETLAGCGGPLYLIGLVDKGNVTNVPTYIKTLRKHAASREVIDKVRAVTDMLYEGEDVGKIIQGLADARHRATFATDPGIGRKTAKHYASKPRPPQDPIIEGVVDMNCICDLIGGSKMMKSFIGLQMSLCIAGGVPFMGLNIPKPRKITYINLEIREDDVHGRVYNMARAMGISDLALENLTILNCRGKSPKVILDALDREIDLHDTEVIVIDPIYFLVDGSENDIEVWMPLLLRLSALLDHIALFYVHHDTKGVQSNAEKDDRDRGSGSSVRDRFIDARIVVSPHKESTHERTMRVLSFVCRSYRDPQPISIEFAGGAFIPVEDEAVKDTGKKKNQRQKVDYKEVSQQFALAVNAADQEYWTGAQAYSWIKSHGVKSNADIKGIWAFVKDEVSTGNLRNIIYAQSSESDRSKKRIYPSRLWRQAREFGIINGPNSSKTPNEETEKSDESPFQR